MILRFWCFESEYLSSTLSASLKKSSKVKWIVLIYYLFYNFNCTVAQQRIVKYRMTLMHLTGRRVFYSIRAQCSSNLRYPCHPSTTPKSVFSSTTEALSDTRLPPFFFVEVSCSLNHLHIVVLLEIVPVLCCSISL